MEQGDSESDVDISDGELETEFVEVVPADLISDSDTESDAGDVDIPSAAPAPPSQGRPTARCQISTTSTPW